MWYNIITVKTKCKRLNKTASVRKENEMEEMTNEQFKIIIEAIIQIVKDNEKETAIKKIEALLNK